MPEREEHLKLYQVPQTPPLSWDRKITDGHERQLTSQPSIYSCGGVGSRVQESAAAEWLLYCAHGQLGRKGRGITESELLTGIKRQV